MIHAITSALDFTDIMALYKCGLYLILLVHELSPDADVMCMSYFVYIKLLHPLAKLWSQYLVYFCLMLLLTLYTLDSSSAEVHEVVRCKPKSIYQ